VPRDGGARCSVQASASWANAAGASHAVLDRDRRPPVGKRYRFTDTRGYTGCGCTRSPFSLGVGQAKGKEYVRGPKILYSCTAKMYSAVYDVKE